MLSMRAIVIVMAFMSNLANTRPSSEFEPHLSSTDNSSSNGSSDMSQQIPIDKQARYKAYRARKKAMGLKWHDHLPSEYNLRTLPDGWKGLSKHERDCKRRSILGVDLYANLPVEKKFIPTPVLDQIEQMRLDDPNLTPEQALEQASASLAYKLPSMNSLNMNDSEEIVMKKKGKSKDSRRSRKANQLASQSVSNVNVNVNEHLAKELSVYPAWYVQGMSARATAGQCSQPPMPSNYNAPNSSHSSQWPELDVNMDPPENEDEKVLL